jgi:hypothetical protein
MCADAGLVMPGVSIFQCLRSGDLFEHTKLRFDADHHHGLYTTGTLRRPRISEAQIPRITIEIK